MIHRELLIGGVFLGGECDQAIGKDLVRSPYDQQLVGTVAEAGAAEVEAAVQSSVDAYQIWRSSSRDDRAALLRRIASSIRERTPELAELAALEIGKPLGLARGELERTALTFELSAHAAEENVAVEIPLDYDSRGREYRASFARFPIGPVLCITPYNWPFNLAAHKIGPALAAGNTVVLKGSSQAPLCTLTLARIIHEAGCPPGVVNAVHTETSIAAALPGDPRIAMVSFTGSPTVGWSIKRENPEKRVSLELGGDAYAVVCEDADLEWAAKRCAYGAFAYAGQICISVQHIVVHESVHVRFRELLLAQTERIEYGDPLRDGVIVGPLISADAAEKVLSWISEAEDSGAKVLHGGNRIGNVVEPTVVEFPSEWPNGLPRLACEEVFGPVVTLRPYTSFDEVIRSINCGEFGIHAGLFTSDRSRIESAFQRLEVGGVVIGDAPNLRFDALPYGGVKRSGFGREGVRFAFEEMTDLKSLVVRE